MSDFHDHGMVKVIAIKKTGSSQLRRCFEEKIWEPRHTRTTWYVTAHRHPAARLVSGWNHLIKDRPKNSYAPYAEFPEFVEWICETPDEGMNDHFRSQAVDLIETLEGIDIGKGAQLMLFQLEQLDDKIGSVVAEHLGRGMGTTPYTAHRHAPWPTYYDKRLLEAVRRRFRLDMTLWWSLYSSGYSVSDVSVLFSWRDKVLNI